jgi:hypothetical protein
MKKIYLIGMIITACYLGANSLFDLWGDPKKNEMVQLYKCKQATTRIYLPFQPEAIEMYEAISWKTDQINFVPESRQDQMSLNGMYSKAMQEASNDGDSINKKKMVEWFTSSYCQSTVEGYKKFKANAAKEETAADNKNDGFDLRSPKQIAEDAAQASNKLLGDKIDQNQNAAPRSEEELRNKERMKKWQDENGFMHYPDGSVSASPVD